MAARKINTTIRLALRIMMVMRMVDMPAVS
jgi:hypothetical protein